MKLLLLGGTGAMGAHLAKILANRGTMVYVTSRSEHTDFDNIYYLQGNAHDVSFVDEVLSLTHYDAIVDFMIYTTTEFAARAYKLLSLTDQYVYISSSRVYSDHDAIITEETSRLLDVCKDKDYISTDEYALTKARQEDILRNSGHTNYTIIRPYITFSESRLQLGPLEKESWLYRALQGGTIVVSKDFYDKRTTLTYGYDVAKGIASIIGRPEALSQTFHITNSKSYTWRELLDCYLDVIESKIGKRPKVLSIDKWRPFMGGGWAQVKYDRIYNRVFDNSKISQFVDVEEFADTKQALKQCISEFMDHPHWFGISPAAELKKDMLTGEKTSMPNARMKFKSKVKLLLVKHKLIWR